MIRRTFSASRRQVLRGTTGGAAGLGAWLAVGCGDDDDSEPTPTLSAGTAAAASSSASTATAAPKPRRGGTIVISSPNEPPNLDPQRAATSAYYWIGAGMAFSSLLKPQSTGANGQLIPTADLADKWEQPDATTVVFKLRPNARWQNIAPVNGRAVTAEDVVYSYKRTVSEKVHADVFSDVKSMEAIDPATLRVQLNEPNADFIASQTDVRVMIVPRESVELRGNLENGPWVGSGPWIFKELRKGVGQFLVRNPDYYVPEQPYADEISIPTITDAAALESQFLAGKLTLLRDNPVPRSTIAKLDPQKFGIYRAPYLANMQTLLSQDGPSFKDVRIRKALSIAIDRELVLQPALDDTAIWESASLFLPDDDWRLPQDEIKKTLAYNPKEAKALYDAAGGIDALTNSAYQSTSTLAAAQVIQANWKAIGFGTDIRPADGNEMVRRVFSPATSDFRISTSLIPHASTLSGELAQWFLPNGVRNGAKVNDQILVNMIRQQKTELNAKARKELVFDIQRYLLDKAYHIPLAATNQLWAHALTTHNVEVPPGTYAKHWFAEVWLES